MSFVQLDGAAGLSVLLYQFIGCGISYYGPYTHTYMYLGSIGSRVVEYLYVGTVMLQHR
jgi:hypothetical protein